MSQYRSEDNLWESILSSHYESYGLNSGCQVQAPLLTEPFHSTGSSSDYF